MTLEGYRRLSIFGARGDRNRQKTSGQRFGPMAMRTSYYPHRHTSPLLTDETLQHADELIVGLLPVALDGFRIEAVVHVVS